MVLQHLLFTYLYIYVYNKYMLTAMKYISHFGLPNLNNISYITPMV